MKLGKKITVFTSLFAAIMLFSSCELLALLDIFNQVGDYFCAYVKNDTNTQITLVVDGNAADFTAEDGPSHDVITLKPGKVKDKAFVSGNYFKLMIGDEILTSDDTRYDDDYYIHNENYYYVGQNTLVTIMGEPGNYKFTVTNRE